MQFIFLSTLALGTTTVDPFSPYFQKKEKL